MYKEKDISVPRSKVKKITHEVSKEKLKSRQILIESLILAQDERWRRA